MKTPYYLIDEAKLRSNGEILHDVEVRSGAKILLAEKAYSIYQTYPIIAEYVSGTTSSGLFEAKLAHEEFHMENSVARSAKSNLAAGAAIKEIHVFEPAFEQEEMEEIVAIADHLYFNSLRQLEYHRAAWEKKPELKVGLRLNPECSTQGDHAIYDPCAMGSRLGIREETLRNFGKSDKPSQETVESEAVTTTVLPAGISGLHMHTLCEQGFDDLETTWRAFEEHFGDYLALDQITWVNLGGGHHITRDNYDVEGLITLIKEIREKYKVDVYLEPGEAVVLNAGELVTRVMDMVETDGLPVLILDTSAACHMPDVIEMPYTPPLLEGTPQGEPGVGVVDPKSAPQYTYRLGSRTCLSGDIVGDYTFDHEVQIGEELHFLDMALYTMVKNNTFNGMPLPAIALKKLDGSVKTLKEFTYEDFKSRL